MPQQLIYTSAPRGLVAGRSGHCTVARSASMREALVLQLEKLSYYQHLSLAGGRERPIFAYRIVDIRGARFHVLSRIQDAGLDFTGRTNFIAHHLVIAPDELRRFPIPPIILRDWSGWVKSWTKEPRLLESEDWIELTALAGKTNVPAQIWQRITGDAVNCFGLLEARTGASFRVDDQADEIVLALFAESLEVLEVRDTRRDYRAAAWNYTFTTSMQEQDNPADFRWRCIHSDNPAAVRFATPDCRALSTLRATKLTNEETALARTGREPPRFAQLTADKYDIQEGSGVRLEVMTDGIPTPQIRWFEIEHNEVKEMDGKSGTTQILSPEGRAKRYQVQAYNCVGNADSNVVEISIRSPVRVPSLQQRAPSTTKLNTNARDESSYETLNQTFEANRAKQTPKFSVRHILAMTCVCAILCVAAFLIIRRYYTSRNANAATAIDSESVASTNTSNMFPQNLPLQTPVVNQNLTKETTNGPLKDSFESNDVAKINSKKKTNSLSKPKQ